MNSLLKQFLLIAITIVAITFLGCEDKTASRGGSQEKTLESEPAPIEKNIDGNPEPKAADPLVQIPDLKGQWTGKFDSRSTTLNITEQTDSSFSGKISINYRDAIHQDISGTISPTKMTINMKDLLHSRYQGKYSGKLSADGKTYTGTFTMGVDGTKLSFSLTRN